MRRFQSHGWMPLTCLVGIGTLKDTPHFQCHLTGSSAKEDPLLALVPHHDLVGIEDSLGMGTAERLTGTEPPPAAVGSFCGQPCSSPESWRDFQYSAQVTPPSLSTQKTPSPNPYGPLY